MKKILTAVLATAMIMAMPVATVFADENDQEITTASGTVQLVASKASAYTVKLPVSVDVSAASTIFKAYVKGDVDGSKKLVIAENNAGQNYLEDDADLKDDVLVNVAIDKAIDGDDIIATYTEDCITFTVTHNALGAGTFRCALPLTISLANK